MRTLRASFPLRGVAKGGRAAVRGLRGGTKVAQGLSKVDGAVVKTLGKIDDVADGDGNTIARARQTGAVGYRALADELYDAIRASSADVAEIAKNTGIKPENIQKMKDHLFNTEHLLDRYVDHGEPAIMARFDSDSGIASAWQRLTAGNFTPADLQQLRHEAAETNRMRKWGPSYNQAAQRRPKPPPRSKPRGLRMRYSLKADVYPVVRVTGPSTEGDRPKTWRLHLNKSYFG